MGMYERFKQKSQERSKTNCFGKEYDDADDDCQGCTHMSDCRHETIMNVSAAQARERSGPTISSHRRSVPPSRPVQRTHDAESYRKYLWERSKPDLGEFGGTVLTSAVASGLRAGGGYVEAHPFNFSRKLKCPECGAKHSRLQEFCGRCGSRIEKP